MCQSPLSARSSAFQVEVEWKTWGEREVDEQIERLKGDFGFCMPLNDY